MQENTLQISSKDCQRLSKIAKDCQCLPLSAKDCQRLTSSSYLCHVLERGNQQVENPESTR